MFRSSLRSGASQARAVSSVSVLARTRTVLPFASRQSVRTPISVAAPPTRVASLSRAYSTEEATTQSDAPAAPSSEDVVRFDELEDVDESLLHAITRDMQYSDMTPVQAKTIKPALKGTDIVAQAKTGTGKTIAFLLPLLQRMLVEDPSLAKGSSRRAARPDDIRGIVLSPTRELAEQIAEEARVLTRHTGLVVQVAVGGTDKRAMLRQTQRRGCHLLVATPGRLNDLLQDERSGIDAPNLAALVLDEADRMLDTGFEAELNNIINRLPSVDEKVRQTMLVSATIPDNVIRLARSMVRANDFEFVQTLAENETLTHDKVPQHIVPVPSWTNVFPALFELVNREAAKAQEDPNARPFKAIVYLNTTALVELGYELALSVQENSRQPVKPFVMQSKLTQAQRQHAANAFRRAKSGILLSSDVTARGMDFPDVTHVIQIDTPRDRESYIHRLGRTGRQNKEGEGWIIVPHNSIRAARSMLRGLPIQQNASLESAEADFASGQETDSFRELKDIFNTMSRSMLAKVYTSMFGQMSGDKRDFADDVHTFVQHGWGWQRPPYVNRQWVQKLGFGRVSGFNIEDGEGGRDMRDDSQRSGGRDRFNGRGTTRGPSRISRDPFDAMSTQVRRDSPRGGRFGRSSF